MRGTVAVRGSGALAVGTALWLVAVGCGGGEAGAAARGVSAGEGDVDAGERGMDTGEPEMDGSQEAHNTLTDAQREAGWRLLFDGQTTAGWRGYRREGVPEGWVAVDGTLHRAEPAGDLITEESFEDFELSLQWKLGPGGNSGVFYLGTEELDVIYKSAPEMQILDDAGHPDGDSPLTSAGAVYGLYPAPEGVARPAGEWNRARILVDDGRVEHWLNGTKVAEYELGSEEWEARVADSKFAQWPEYGGARRGHIGLQDHGDPVWFRDIMIRELR